MAAQIAFISVLALSLTQWGGKSISPSTDMRQISYIQCPTYVTPLMVNWNYGKNLTSDCQYVVQDILKHAFRFCESWVTQKHFTKYQCDANLLYPTSYVYNTTNIKIETKGEISF